MNLVGIIIKLVNTGIEVIPGTEVVLGIKIISGLIILEVEVILGTEAIPGSKIINEKKNSTKNPMGMTNIKRILKNLQNLLPQEAKILVIRVVIRVSIEVIPKNKFINEKKKSMINLMAMINTNAIQEKFPCLVKMSRSQKKSTGYPE